MEEKDLLKYEKISHRDQILLRPGMYCGSMEEIQEQSRWMLKSLDPVTGIPELEFRENVTYVPGLESVIDELLVNASDHVQREPSTTRIDIDFDENHVTVKNNGPGIPVQQHPKHKIWIPEMIFGHLLTSTNYEKSQTVTTGGQNGLGAKVACIFASKFEVETVCEISGKKFKGTWKNNMEFQGSRITSAVNKKGYTKVSFYPDWSRIGSPELCRFTKDQLDLLGKRCIDIAGTVHRNNVKVYINGVCVNLSPKGFPGYASLFVDDKKIPCIQLNDYWQVAVSFAETSISMSFINNICTDAGGSHEDRIQSILLKQLLAALKKKFKDLLGLKPAIITRHLAIFINGKVQNPSFNSQTKDKLQTPVDRLRIPKEFPKKFIDSLIASPQIQFILDEARQGSMAVLTKTDGSKRSKLTGIPKLEDANKAGTKQSNRCTLILTEGDSAKALAMSGLTVVGRDYYGVFPLRGKPLNVRDATTEQLSKNEEVINLKKILGLHHGMDYTDSNSLRYGKVMLMTDADYDGSHIKGLLLNLFHYCWPGLLKADFLYEFITPVVRVSRKSEKDSSIDFYSLSEYSKWCQENDSSKWFVKYYKGLGTSTAADARKYFSNLDKHVIKFIHSTSADDDSLVLAFDKTKADARKTWLADTPVAADDVASMDVEEISTESFVHDELILFSLANNERSIPSVIDGLKPSTRKILYTMLSQGMYQDTKLVSAAGKVMEATAYHHGEASLHGTMIGMAQDFMGSNNINLLYPSGQFGTRATGGKDHASPRYIFTCLSKEAPLIYPVEDLPVLQYVFDDGQQVEPKRFYPILPMVLVNGVKGIGTGWSTDIPPFNPDDIIENIFHRMTGQPLIEMHPWYRGFNGEIVKTKPGHYVAQGVVKVDSDSRTITITELPPGRWTNDFKQLLEKMLASKKITGYSENHPENGVYFEISLNQDQFQKVVVQADIHKFFEGKLTMNISTTNMVAFNGQFKLHRYESPEEILLEYYHYRVQCYHDRKHYNLNMLEKKLQELSWKVEFIQCIITGVIDVKNRSKADITTQLTTLTKIPVEFMDSLMDMNIWSLTRERMETLMNQHRNIQESVYQLQQMSPEDLWRQDLEKFQESKQVLKKKKRKFIS